MSQQPVLAVQGAVGQQTVGLALRYGEHDGVGGELLPAVRAALHRDLPAVVTARDGGGAGAQLDPDTGLVQRGAGEGVVDVAERDAGPADVGGAGVGEQPGLEDLGGQAQRGVVGAWR